MKKINGADMKRGTKGGGVGQAGVCAVRDEKHRFVYVCEEERTEGKIKVEIWWHSVGNTTLHRNNVTRDPERQITFSFMTTGY